jgi:hypothetical protein
MTAARVLVNFTIYGVGFLAATRLFHGGQAMPPLMCVAFLVASVVVGLWSKRWEVAVPAGLGFLWGLGAFKWAIHLTDTRGEYAPPMSQYVLDASRSEVMWAIAVAASAGVGWSISVLLRKGLGKRVIAA